MNGRRQLCLEGLEVIVGGTDHWHELGTAHSILSLKVTVRTTQLIKPKLPIIAALVGLSQLLGCKLIDDCHR